MFHTDRIPSASRLAGASIVVKAYLSGLMLVLCLLADNILYSLIVIIIMAAASLLFSGVSPRRYLLLCLIPLAFIVIGVLTIAVSVQETSFGVLTVPAFGRYIGISRAGGLLAAGIGLKSFGCIVSLYFLLLTTPMPDILGALYRLPLPRIFVEIMMLTYRFIFELLETGTRMHTAQRARLCNSTYRTSLHATGILASGVFIRSLKKSGDIYNAMEARGYDGTLPYFEKKTPVGAAGAAVMIGATLLMLALLIAAKTAW